MWYVRKPGDAWFTNAFVSMLLFPVWAYALGSVAFAGYWDGNLAAILLASASILSGLFAPQLPRGRKRRKEHERELEEERARMALAKRMASATKDPAPEPVPAPVAAAAASAKK
jgi:hypothetical protein